MAIVIGRNTAICVGAPTFGIVGTDAGELDGVAVPAGDAVGPGRELGAGPLEAVVRWRRNCPCGRAKWPQVLCRSHTGCGSRLRVA